MVIIVNKKACMRLLRRVDITVAGIALGQLAIQLSIPGIGFYDVHPGVPATDLVFRVRR